MPATGEGTNTESQPGSTRRRNDHLLLWVVLMLGLVAASIWWLLSQSWTGATSGVMDRVVVVPEQPATTPDAVSADTAPAAGSSAGKPDAAAAARKPSTTPKKTVASRTRDAGSTSRLTRSAHPLADNPPPRYPASALRSGVEGNVLIRAEIDAGGTPTDVGFARRSGNRELDRAALNAVRSWRFRPALRNGKAVASAVQVPVDFVLDERAAR